MGKYEPLARYLKSLPDDTWNATFAEIERRLGFTLPKSAREHRAWWANQRNANHSQTAGWRDAGWETESVDLKRGQVRFTRRKGGNRLPAPEPDLWRTAKELSGITDRDELIAEALKTLIHRETARALAELGGSMPDFTLPERERPAW